MGATAEAAERTRQALLAAARQEFAEHGIAGARVDRIAAASGVNKQRIYANFTSKEGLFDAVMAQAMDELVDAVPAQGDPAHYAAAVYDFHRDHPDLLRLFLWESLQYRDQPLPGDDERTARYRDKITWLAEATGLPDAQAAAQLLLLIGCAAWPTAVTPMTRLIAKAAGAPLDTRQAIIDHATAALHHDPQHE